MERVRELSIRRGVTAIIGSGGKTSLLYTLGEELAEKGHRVILTTTTHIKPPRTVPLTDGRDAAALLEEHRLICVGSKTPEGKLTAGALPLAELCRLAEYVLVEADGSKRLPLKAHAPHEPVIPPEAGRTLLVVGASGLNRPIGETVHRPEIFCRLTGATPEDRATPELVAEVIRRENLGDLVVINQRDANETAARALQQCLTRPSILLSLKEK